MHSEKRDNLLAERLADTLPEGSGFREEAVWQWLSASLQQARKKKRVVMLRMAAALLLLPMAWWLLHNSGPETVATPTAGSPAQEQKRTQKPQYGQHEKSALAAKSFPKSRKVPDEKQQERATEVALATPPLQYILREADTASVEATATTTATTATPQRRFRVSHMNETPLPIPVTNELPAEEGSNTGFLRAANNTGGSSADLSEPTPAGGRRSRTLMSVFKSHQ